MGYRYRDVFDFREKHPSEEEREEQLLNMDHDEIMHLAETCENLNEAIYFGRFARLARQRERDGGYRRWRVKQR